MVRLDALERWFPLPVGQVLTLPGKAPRSIRLQVNCPDKARLFTVDQDGELVFLATAERRDRVDFLAAGDVKITTQDEDVFVFSSELEPTYSVVEAPAIFTKIATRAARNPQLEEMMYRMEANAARRQAALAAELAQQVKDAFNAGRAAGAAATQPVEQEPDEDGDGRSSGEADPAPEPAG